MLHRNERGIPAIPYRLMVEGTWREGKTLLSHSPPDRGGAAKLLARGRQSDQ
jgi:hypothetical protein